MWDFPSKVWSSQYPSQVEILAYMKNVAEKHQLYSRAKFRHKVLKLEWLEDRMKWKANILEQEKEQLHTIYFDFV